MNIRERLDYKGDFVGLETYLCEYLLFFKFLSLGCKSSRLFVFVLILFAFYICRHYGFDVRCGEETIYGGC